MAYIRCASCQKTVSSKATICPYCKMPPLSRDGKAPEVSEEETPAEVTTGASCEGESVRKKKKKSPATPKKKKRELPDMTRSNTIKRFLLHTLCSVIGYGVAFVLAGLLIEILEELFAPQLVLSTLKHTRAFLTGSAIVLGFALGACGPMAHGAYRKAEEKKSIIRARALPLQWLSLVYVAFGAIALVLYFVFRAKLPHVVENNVGTDKEILTLAISFSVAIYYALYALGSFINVIIARCPQCHHIDCKIKYGESEHAFSEQTETRERKVAGASYDVYTTSGTHVGTITGSDSTVEESRTVTTEDWSSYWRCAICGHCGQTKESDTHKSSWS